MTAYILDWLSLLARWFHVLVGIAWIGGSFLYVWMDNHLERPPQWKADKGIKGDVWAIHGGGIYEFQKYQVAPAQMPATLHWVKWESYFTWLSGMALLAFIYYGQARSYMMIDGGLLSEPWMAVVAGLGFLAGASAGYEILIRTPLVNKGQVFAATMVIYLLGLSYLAMALFAPRAAVIHLGAAIGTLMVGNVFFGIIPSQKRFIAAIEAGQPPDVAGAAFAKLRSTHNNYLTLPVLLCMVANHYPMLYSRESGWLLIVVVAAISAYARHFFNLRHRGIYKPHILVVAAAALLLVAVLIRPETAPARTGAEVVGQVADGMPLVQKHCTGCHRRQPTQPGFVAPPAGVLLESEAQVLALAARIKQVSVATHYMPLGNVTQMQEVERRQLGAWLDARISGE
ncbi:urate hydroxylase PuuD [Exilibacterium tricleocarpae]|uniref:Urate hydroxylase PuuD n=1 Tax=Exilibacterium tricleocarpae TaxID=2591008 RepID=A0A545U9Q8_9GAMM|nr:urate hydroxylase PuuD [Exilibacterium tricleocarpae]TQV86207.1 urate hydroxylase PuuD [Exilibacterium tricleocarpae]